jgi:hypothetical protein
MTEPFTPLAPSSRQANPTRVIVSTCHRLPWTTGDLDITMSQNAPKEPGFIFATALGCLCTDAFRRITLWPRQNRGSVAYAARNG